MGGFFVFVFFFFCSLQGLIYAFVKEVCKHFCSACSVILVQRLVTEGRRIRVVGLTNKERSPGKRILSQLLYSASSF